MEFEFDPEKAAANPINHDGVTFEEAKLVLFDPYALTQRMLMRKVSSVLFLWAWRQGADSVDGVDAAQ